MGLFSFHSVQLRLQMALGWLQNSWKLPRGFCFVLLQEEILWTLNTTLKLKVIRVIILTFSISKCSEILDVSFSMLLILDKRCCEGTNILRSAMAETVTACKKVLITDNILSCILCQSLLQCIFLFKPQHRISLWTQQQAEVSYCMLFLENFLSFTSLLLQSLKRSRRLRFVWSNASIFSNKDSCCRLIEAACRLVNRLF